MSDQADQCPADSGRLTQAVSEIRCRIPGGLGFKELNPQPRVLLWVPPPWGTGLCMSVVSALCLCVREHEKISKYFFSMTFISEFKMSECLFF